MDAITNVFEIADFRDEPLTGLTNDPFNYSYVRHDYTNHLRENYDMVSQWRKVLDKYNSRILSMEIYANVSKLMEYYTYGATFPFNYDFIDTVKNYSSPQDFKDVIDMWVDNLPKGATVNWAVSR